MDNFLQQKRDENEQWLTSCCICDPPSLRSSTAATALAVSAEALVVRRGETRAFASLMRRALGESICESTSF